MAFSLTGVAVAVEQDGGEICRRDVSRLRWKT